MVRNVPGAIEEDELRIDGVRVFYRRVPGEGTPTVYCHGNPTHGEDWLPFLEKGDGPAFAIDMPGWGRSDYPDPAHFDYSMYGLSAFLEKCLDELGVAQIWRRRGLGELANATATKGSMGLIMRQLSGDRRPMPPQFIEMIWRHMDHGTNQATLALYRHADPDRLALAGKDLGRLACPSLVLWGANDPFLQPRFAEAYADALPSSTLQLVPAAGHWPWIDDARVVDRVLEFIV